MFFAVLVVSLLARSADAGDAVVPGELVVEPPTLICLGFEWDITGDDDRDATVSMRYRKTGEKQWRVAPPLLRTTRPSAQPGQDRVRLFAGSVIDLLPDTSYECRLDMADPDGVEGQSTRLVTARTRAEPVPYSDGRVLHVYPRGYEGAKREPAFNDIMDAYYDVWWESDFYGIGEGHVRPGDTILVHAGTYGLNRRAYHQPYGTAFYGTYFFTLDGTPRRPITIKAAGDGPVVFDGDGCEALFDVSGADYHIFEGLHVRNCRIAFRAGVYNVTGCDGLAVKRCTMEDIGIGVEAPYHGSEGFYVADNRFVGRLALDQWSAWGPLDSYYAVKVNGSGHVVCHNYAAGFYDGIDVFTEPTMRAGRRVAIDFYNNDLFRMNDNFLEADGGTHNIRILRNRGLNCGSVGLSNQPVRAGPVYWIRNVCYNTSDAGAIKNMSNPTGILVYHNTITGNLRAWGTPPFGYADYRNNLFMGPGLDIRKPVICWNSTDRRSVLDYNAYRLGDAGSEEFDPAFQYGGGAARRSYPTFDAFRRETGLEKHGLLLDFGIFRNLPEPARPKRRVYRAEELDFRLRADSRAVDAGYRLPGINDEFTGAAPDLGAYEVGQTTPQYGPRPE
jgi:hypothetical protein